MTKNSEIDEKIATGLAKVEVTLDYTKQAISDLKITVRENREAISDLKAFKTKLIAYATAAGVAVNLLLYWLFNGGK